MHDVRPPSVLAARACFTSAGDPGDASSSSADSGTWRVARGAWHVARGTWRVARGAWRVARGAWRVARGAWRVARGAWRVGVCRVVSCRDSGPPRPRPALSNHSHPPRRPAPSLRLQNITGFARYKLSCKVTPPPRAYTSLKLSIMSSYLTALSPPPPPRPHRRSARGARRWTRGGASARRGRRRRSATATLVQRAPRCVDGSVACSCQTGVGVGPSPSISRACRFFLSLLGSICLCS